MKIPPECIQATRKCTKCRNNYCRRCEYPVKFIATLCPNCYFLQEHPLARLKPNVLLNRLRRIGLQGLSLRELVYLYENKIISSFDYALRKKYKKDAFARELAILHNIFHFSYE